MYAEVLPTQQPHQHLRSPHSHLQGLHRDPSAGPGWSVMAQPVAQNAADGRWSGQTCLQPEQYVACPMQRRLSSPNGTSAPSPRPPNQDIAEHMLRRKTPNGTLAAGYDGSPIDSDAKAHAPKHFLMPASCNQGPTRHLRDHHTEGYISHALPSQLNQFYATDFLEARQHARCAKYQGNHDSIEASFVNGSVSYQGQRVDSFLNQGIFAQHDPIFLNGQKVPTVLQPMWPPCIGLTSNNNTGPYGPYWPDGAYEPYRPAPLRDPRYCQQLGQCDISGTESNPSTRAWLPWDVATRQYQHHERTDRLDYQSKYLEQQSFHDVDPNSQHRPNPPTRGSAHLYQQNRGSSLPREQALSQDGRKDSDNWGIHEPLSSLDGVTPHPARQAGNAQFKEKALVWAHRIYVNLIASIHHARRNVPNGQQPGERRFLSNVYPKPPRQTYFHPAMAAAQEPFNDLEQQGPALEAAPLKPFAHCNAQKPNFSVQADIAPDNTLETHRFQTMWDKNQCQYWNAQKHHGNSGFFGQHKHSLNYNYAEPTVPVQPQHEQSPAAAATHAMDMLSRLCSESGWQWTDGMLLGGCLAYGLGDFARALKWYSKVLTCDPKYKTSCPLSMHESKSMIAMLRPSPILLQPSWHWGGGMMLSSNGGAPSVSDLVTLKLSSTWLVFSVKIAVEKKPLKS